MNETKRYYIAYGSNLSIRQMAHRCPDAKIEGVATLGGWQLLFRAYATIKPNPKKRTPVLIWSISEADEKSLDHYEGYPTLYYKKELQVTLLPTDPSGARLDTQPKPIKAMVYIMPESRCPLREPSPFYYGVLEDGYRTFDFPMQTLKNALADSIGRSRAQSWLEDYKIGREMW